jgi:hypothetical protein
MIAQGINIGTGRITDSAWIMPSFTTPFVAAYTWTYASGWGTKFSNPATAIAGGGRSAITNRARTVAVIGNDTTSPFLNAYAWNNRTGFGSKYTAPASPPSATLLMNMDFSPDQKALVLNANNNSPYIWAYPWTDASGFGTRFANPGTTSPNDVRTIKCHPRDPVVMTGGGTAPRLGVWNFTSSGGWGSKLAAPATQATTVVSQLAFTKSGDVVTGALDQSPFLTAYAWTNGNIGTRYAQPTAGFPSQFGTGSGWNASETVVFNSAFLSSAQPQLIAFPFNKTTGFGTKFANMTTITASNGAGSLSVNSEGTVVTTTLQNTPFLMAYQWNDRTGWGTKYSNPVSLPPGGGAAGLTFA